MTKTFLFQGPVGQIETLVTDADKATGTAIICHPHPLYGGTMNNKVVTTMARVFHDLGLRTVRFNFRGVGKSEGTHADGVGETDDVLAIAEWIKTVNPNDVLWLAGFSFGGYVAAAAATKLNVSQLVTVAPQVSRFSAAHMSRIGCPWLVIQGEEDDVISPDAVYDWVETLDPKPVLIRIPNAGHFFHGQLGALKKALEKGVVST